MKTTISEKDLIELKKIIKESFFLIPLRNKIMNYGPDYLKPYAHIDPYASDAKEQINAIFQTLNYFRNPVWIQNLIDKGLLDTDCKTVIGKSLDVVALEIMKSNVQVTNVMLQKFINGKTNKPYSKQSINHAVDYANTK